MKSKSMLENGDTDPRFAAARTDPRFQRFPKSQRKVEIDERFADMFKDKAFQVRSAVDKRGRKIGKSKQKEDMRKYYRLPETQADNARPSQPQTQEQNGIGNAKALSGTPEAKREKVRSKSEKASSAQEDKRKASKRKASTSIDLQDRKRAKPEVKAANMQNAKASAVGSSSPEDTGESEEEDEGDRRAAERWARVRGLTGPDTSSSDSSEEDNASEDASSEEQSSSGDEDIDVTEWGVGAMAGNPDEEVPEVSEETARLAILDLDWSKVKAVDILAMLQSFLKKGQQIKRVTVYPSDYGLQRMAEEARLGPQGLASVQDRNLESEASEQEGIIEGQLSKNERAAILEALNEEESGEEGSASETNSERDDREANEASPSSSDSDVDDDVAKRRLQMYERSRLRYYYAIAECNDVTTAKHLYAECDGMEFEHSANLFDLRYVPDTEDFSKREVRESAASVPSGYRAPEVGAAAMLHTNPKLTWDAEDEGRKRMLHKRVSKQELRDDDFKAYLGSESDEDDVPAPERASQADRYRQLLTGSASIPKPGKGDEAAKGSDEDSDLAEKEEVANEGMEMEVTFGGGLDDLSQKLNARLAAKANKSRDTVWQAYLRKREEKRKRAKARGRKVDEDEDDIPSSDGEAEQDPYFKRDKSAFDDPFFRDDGEAGQSPLVPEQGSEIQQRPSKSKGKKRHGDSEEADAERRRQAQLELLLMDDKALKDAVKLGAPSGASTRDADTSMPKLKLSKKARIAAKKAAKRAARGAASDDEDIRPSGDGSKFVVDVSDSRFDALFTSPDFALDPTDPRYTASEAAKSIQKEAASRRGAKNVAKHSAAPHSVQTIAQGTAGNGSDKLKALVASLKRKGTAAKQWQ